MKILFVGDYSGFHASIAAELRRRGHECMVISDGSRFMQTRRDIDVQRKPGFWGGISYLYNLLQLLPTLKGYDFVQLIGTHFLQLRPGKLSYILKTLKRQNGKVILSLCAPDYFYVSTLSKPSSPLQYSEYGNSTGRPTDYMLHCEAEIDNWLLPVNMVWAKQVYEDVDGAVSALYEYHKVWQPYLGDKMKYIGIGVDPRSLDYSPLDTNLPLRIMTSIKPESARQKGIYLIEQSLRRIASRHPGKIEIVNAQGLSFTSWLSLLKQCHILADQLYSYTPATAALQAMALGRVPISGGEEDYYNFLQEKDLRPIINIDPRDNGLDDYLEPLLLDRNGLMRRSSEGRTFVERHNDIRKVADRLLDAYRQC